jgi:UDP-3-O-[3-hydroxymyristoyl] N-acetylglucosamine deacetylase/3-hydroxyacyl-[acyl-carrier-protein] dehydratase
MPANSGISFTRADIEKSTTINATAENVSSTERSTTLAKGNASVQTVEHALAALAGLQIDNASIDVNGGELPILDGSAKPFVDAFIEAGVEELNEDRNYYEIDEVITYKDEESGAEITVFPADHFEVTALVDYNSPYISTQYASMSKIEDFEKEIAPCRTFGFLNEVEALLDQGLIKGGSLENAVVVKNTEVLKSRRT